MYGKFLSPKNNVAFKKIFGMEEHKGLLIHFLNGVLDLEGDKCIEQVDFINPVQAPRLFGYKQSVVDILCKDHRNIRYIVEMQVTQKPGFEQRAQYYAAKAYVGQLERSENYPRLNQVIFLAITDHILFPNKPHYKSAHITLDRESHEHDLKDFFFTFIELPKFNLQEHELETIEQKWIYFLKYADKTTEIPRVFQGTPIEEAYHVLEHYLWSEGEMLSYEDAALAIIDSENAVQVGRDEGRAEGLAAGQHLAKIEMAKKLMALEMDIKQIELITGLSSNELNTIPL
jgi:predicted transposase/invertase (TIGR01784 family)